MDADKNEVIDDDVAEYLKTYHKSGKPGSKIDKNGFMLDPNGKGYVDGVLEIGEYSNVRLQAEPIRRLVLRAIH